MPGPCEEHPPGERLLSIDALRGFDMFWIIGGHWLVHALLKLTAGGVPPSIEAQMRHASWEGFTAWDLIMPLFLFVVGAVMPFSFGRRIEAGERKSRTYRRVVRRVLLLWVLGMIAQGNLLEFDLSKLKIYTNTLQCIAVGYLVAAVLLIHARRWIQALVTAGFLLGYWALMKLVPFDGHPAGTMEPGVSLAHTIDVAVLGQFVYSDRGYAWILPSMNYAATVLLGVFAGHLLRDPGSPWRKILGLVARGLVFLALGWIIAGGPASVWDAQGLTEPAWAASLCDWLWQIRFPMNKHLVTSSMVLWAAGWSYLLLALFYLVLDIWRLRAWAFPFIVIGSNAIVAYMLTHPHYLSKTVDAYIAGLTRLAGAYGYLIPPIAQLAAVWLILYFLYRHKVFVRV